MRANRYPALVIDSGGVAQLAHVPRARSTDDLIRRVWGQRTHAAITPADADQVDALARAVLAAGRVNVLVDEAGFWLGSTKGKGSPLLRLLRAWRHARANVLLTTQHLSGDVSQAALSCAPTLYVFRCTSAAVLERLERDYGLAPARVRGLQRGSFLRVETGFSS